MVQRSEGQLYLLKKRAESGRKREREDRKVFGDRTGARLTRDEVVGAEKVAILGALDDVKSTRLYKQEEEGLGRRRSRTKGTAKVAAPRLSLRSLRERAKAYEPKSTSTARGTKRPLEPSV